MKLKLVFKSAKEVIEIAKQIDSETYTGHGCYLSAIIDND